MGFKRRLVFFLINLWEQPSAIPKKLMFYHVSAFTGQKPPKNRKQLPLVRNSEHLPLF